MLFLTITINEVEIPEPLQLETPSDRYYNLTASIRGNDNSGTKIDEFETLNTWTHSAVEFAVAKSLEKFINKSAAAK